MMLLLMNDQHEHRITSLRAQLNRVTSAGKLAGLAGILAALVISQFAPHFGLGFGATAILMAGSLTSAVSLGRKRSLKAELDRELHNIDLTVGPDPSSHAAHQG
jgi:hypothetical protein